MFALAASPGEQVRARASQEESEGVEIIDTTYNRNGNPARANLDPAHIPATVAPSAEERTLTLGDLLRAVWRRLWLVALTSIVLASASIGLSLAQTPLYEASIKILVGQEGGIIESPNDVDGLQQLTQTMADAVSDRPTAEAVIRELDLPVSPEQFIAENLSVEQVAETQFIQVHYRDADPERAQRVANTIGAVFSEQVSEISPNADSITATVWEPASVPQSPVSPNPLRNGVLALAVGLIIGLSLAFLLEYLDESWRSPEEAERVSGVPTLGVVPAAKAREKEGEAAG